MRQLYLTIICSAILAILFFAALGRLPILGVHYLAVVAGAISCGILLSEVKGMRWYVLCVGALIALGVARLEQISMWGAATIDWYIGSFIVAIYVVAAYIANGLYKKSVNGHERINE